MKRYEVSADFSITKTIGIYEAESEAEAIDMARDRIHNIGHNLGIYCADSIWAEEKEEV